MPFGYLLELFLNFIDFGDIDECDISLTVYSFEFEAFIVGATVYYIHFLFY